MSVQNVKNCYFDQLHREVACKVGPGAPIPEPLDPAATLFWSLVEHEDPEKIHDNEGPEVLESTEIKEGHGTDGDRRHPEQHGASLKPSLDRQAERGKNRHGINC